MYFYFEVLYNFVIWSDIYIIFFSESENTPNKKSFIYKTKLVYVYKITVSTHGSNCHGSLYNVYNCICILHYE